jgi:hypothetical protein
LVERFFNKIKQYRRDAPAQDNHAQKMAGLAARPFAFKI